MLLHSRGSNTLRLLERQYGAELRFNRQIIFTNTDLTRMIKVVLNAAEKGEYLNSSITEHEIDIDQVRSALVKLSDAGIPLSFWGDVWCESNAELDLTFSERKNL